MTYVVTLLITLFLCVFCKTVKTNLLGRKVELLPKTVICFFPFFFLMAFRWNLGVDTFYGIGHYSRAYYLASQGINTVNYPWLFFKVYSFFSSLGIPLFWFYFFVTCIYFYSIISLIKDLHLDITWSCLAFFGTDMLIFAFSAVRQSLSLSFVIFALKYYFVESNRSNIKCIVFLILASMIHPTCVVYVFIFGIEKILTFNSIKEISRKRIINLIIGGIISSPILYIAAKFLLNNSNYALNSVELKFTSSYLLFYAILLYFCYESKNQILCKNSKFDVLIIAVIILFVAAIISPAIYHMDRVFHLFSPIYLIVIPTIAKSISKKEMKVVFRCLMIFMFCVFLKSYFIVGNINYETYGHYTSVFENWDYYTHLTGK